MTKADTTPKKFSIIVPMYNAAAYVAEAFESALAQDTPLGDYELIVVDDHSDDNSREIATGYETKFPGTFRLLTNPGKGVSDARNFGIENAAGKYILFLDADDQLEANVLAGIYKAMENGRLDVLVMTYNMMRDGGSRYKSKNILGIEKNGREIISGRDFMLKGRYRGIVWMYAYRREFLVRSGVRMLRIRHEDENFVPRILARAERVSYAPIEHYVYRLRDDSYMNSYSPGNLFDLLDALARMRDDIITAYPHDRKLCDKITDRVSSLTMGAVKRAVRDGFGNEIEVIEEARSKSLIPVRNRKGDYKRFLLNHFPRAFIALYRRTAKKRDAVR